jgi:rhodanese-related sulfurtransferase
MRWKQFFTPVQSVSSEKGRELVQQMPVDDLILLDVRQVKEYRAGHIPGAKLIPLPELDDRLDELDPTKKILVY